MMNLVIFYKIEIDPITYWACFYLYFVKKNKIDFLSSSPFFHREHVAHEDDIFPQPTRMNEMNEFKNDKQRMRLILDDKTLQSL